MHKPRISIVIILLCCLGSSFTVGAQGNKASLDVGMDLVSRYIWRGMNLSTSPAAQPYIELSKGNFTFGSWGSYTFNAEPYQEVDLYMSYSMNSITLTVNDYFVPVDSLSYSNNYFDWGKNTTSHMLEAVLSIDEIGGSPLSFSAGVGIGGNDIDGNGDNYYSTYFEFGYGFSVGETEVNSFLGLTPSEGIYADSFSLVNIGLSASKEIIVSDKFSLPINGSFIINPNTENVYLVVGLSF